MSVHEQEEGLMLMCWCRSHQLFYSINHPVDPWPCVRSSQLARSPTSDFFQDCSQRMISLKAKIWLAENVHLQ